MIDDDTIRLIKAVGWTVVALAVGGFVGLIGSAGYAIYRAAF